MLQGLCRQVDPDLWFPPKSGSTREAKRICNGYRGQGGCPVRLECAAWALKNREPHGVWGGLSELDRRRILRQSPC